jgi:23S rRNA (uridine2552-2'-O)-methyltransferase
VKAILDANGIQQVDFIQSDMAPNTIGTKDVDAMRSFALLEQTLWIYETLLKPDGKFVTKLFMGPGFDEYLAHLKKVFGGKNIKTFKPKSCRKESKEIYVIKI